MRRVCIHQPDFAPYLGFFHRLYRSDVYIVLDDVQFLRRGWHHRDKIKTATGEAWLTLSIRKADYHVPIGSVELHPDYDDWVPHNLNLIRQNYARAPYFPRYFPILEEIYGKRHRRLVDMAMDLLGFFFTELDIAVEVVFSSDLAVPGQKNEKLINLVRAVGGDHYISGTGALSYLDPGMFEKAGIGLEVQSFSHPVYPQQFGGFIPYLSCIDAFMNCGPGLKGIVQAC